jgi:hypothetical protein
LSSLLSIVSGLVGKAVKALGLPPGAQAVVTHAVIVFVSTFVGQIALAAGGVYHLSSIKALAPAAAAAALSAVVHYFAGIVPPTSVTVEER